MSKPFFSIGIIFKNEIRCLERCLKSLQPLKNAIPCEIVMADTGSTDGSREIAEQYADVLFDFEWVDDFSAARNAVMDRCSGQWYFSIDADEWLLEDIAELVQFSKLKKAPRDYCGVMVRNYKTTELEKGEHYVDFTAIRMAKLSTGMRYSGRIHEKWVQSTGEGVFVSILGKTWLGHDGYAYFSQEAVMQKHDRNMALLKKKMEDDPKDLQTYIECMDSSKSLDENCGDYARQALEVFFADQERWGHFGGVVYRGIVSVASLHELPELEEWISLSKDYSKSIFVNIDVAFDAHTHYYQKDDYEEAIHWGEMYRKGIADYRADQFDHVELIRGVVERVSPYWERKIMVSLVNCYLNCKEYDKALTALQELTAETLDAEQARFVTLMIMQLHRETEFDTPALMMSYWETLSKELPEDAEEDEKNKAQKNLDSFTKEAYGVFTPKYRKEEQKKEGFLRYSYTVFLPLAGKDDLGDSAVLLETKDPGELTEKLNQIENLDSLPIHVLSHAMMQGVEFPMPGKPLQLEEMSRLVNRLLQERESFFTLVEKIMSGNYGRTLQSLCWAKELITAALKNNDWAAGKIPEGKMITLSMDGPAESHEDLVARGMNIARAFAQVERKYLPLCYAQDILRREALFVLPPLHRFGWYCAQAFQALDRGDQVGYVRLLREGLSDCESAKDVAEFLLEHIPDVKPQEPSAELTALAEQVRAMLERFSTDDPMLEALKQSEAYQKVAYLIEGSAVPVRGGILQ